MKHKQNLIKSAKARVTGTISYCHGKVPHSRKLLRPCSNDLCLPPLWWGDILFLSCPSICLSQFVSATPLKLLNRISWYLVGSKDTICSCAYYQEILIAWILWELCPFELRNLLLKQLVSTTPLKLLNIISWNLVGSKDTICSCAYY
jgi:hypothetical protein